MNNKDNDLNKITIYHACLYESELFSIPNRPGSYIITHVINNTTERYVGFSSNLCQRFQGHRNKDIKFVDFYATDDIPTAERLEKVLIRLIKPETNLYIPPLTREDKIMLTVLMKDYDKIRGVIKDAILDDYCRNIINTHDTIGIEICFLPLELDTRKMHYNMDEWKKIADNCKKISKDTSEMYFSLLEKYPKSSKHMQFLCRTRYNFTKVCELLEKEMFHHIKTNNIEYKDEYDKMFHPICVQAHSC